MTDAARIAELERRLAIAERRLAQLPTVTAQPPQTRSVVRQAAHGFSVGTPLSCYDGTYFAITSPNSSLAGVVSRIISADVFELAGIGEIVEYAGDNLAVGDYEQYLVDAGSIGDGDEAYYYHLISGSMTFLERLNASTCRVTYGRVASADYNDATVRMTMINSGEANTISAGHIIARSPSVGPYPGNTAGKATASASLEIVGIAVANPGGGLTPECPVRFSGTSIVVFSGTSPQPGQPLYISSDTPGTATNEAPTSGDVVQIGTCLSAAAFQTGQSWSTVTPLRTCVYCQITANIKIGSGGIEGIVPLENGGTGRDFTAGPAANGVVYKDSASTLGVTINPGDPGVLVQAAAGVPYFLASTANSQVLRRTSGGGLAWGKVVVSEDLSGAVPLAYGGTGRDFSGASVGDFVYKDSATTMAWATYVPLTAGGGGRNLSAITTNAVMYKDSSTTLGGTLNTGGTLGALVQSSSGVPYFLNFDVGNSIDVSGGRIKAMVATKETGTTAPTSNLDLLNYNTTTGKWAPKKMVTTKGDLMVTDGTAFYRLPVGTSGQALVADSSESVGVKWATASSTPYGFAPFGTIAYNKATSGSYSYTTTKRFITVLIIGGGAASTGGSFSTAGYIAASSGGSANTPIYAYLFGISGGAGGGLLMFFDLTIGTVISGSVGAGGSTSGADGGDTTTTINTSTFTAQGGHSYYGGGVNLPTTLPTFALSVVGVLGGDATDSIAIAGTSYPGYYGICGRNIFAALTGSDFVGKGGRGDTSTFQSGNDGYVIIWEHD
jgi:hypothetical protein